MDQAQLLMQMDAYNKVCKNCGKQAERTSCVTCPVEATRQQTSVDYIKSQHPQLKGNGVPGHRAELSSHIVIRIMILEDLERSGKEDTTERVTQITTIQKARWEGRLC